MLSIRLLFGLLAIASWRTPVLRTERTIQKMAPSAAALRRAP